MMKESRSKQYERRLETRSFNKDCDAFDFLDVPFRCLWWRYYDPPFRHVRLRVE